jgi:hypothetical protein
MPTATTPPRGDADAKARRRLYSEGYYSALVTRLQERLQIPAGMALEEYYRHLWDSIDEGWMEIFNEMTISVTMDKDGGAEENGVFIYVATYEPFDHARNVFLRDALIDELESHYAGGSQSPWEGETIMETDDYEKMRALCDPHEDDEPSLRIIKKLLMVFVEEKTK